MNCIVGLHRELQKNMKSKYLSNKTKLLGVLIIVGILSSLFGCSDPVVQVDFKNISYINTPNYYLVCPPKYCSITPHEIGPVYPIEVKHVDIHWQQVIEKQPRVTLVAEDKAKHQYTYIQRTKYLGFPDTINVQLLSLDKNHTTVLIYSQSKYGYSDLGVNKARVKEWLSQLSEDLGKQHKLIDH